jgi:hypothetical protein
MFGICILIYTAGTYNILVVKIEICSIYTLLHIIACYYVLMYIRTCYIILICIITYFSKCIHIIADTYNTLAKDVYVVELEAIGPVHIWRRNAIITC